MSKPILFMMLGIPGSGKTSVSEHIAELTDAVHISSDQFRKHMFDKPDKITDVEHEQIYDMLDYIAEKTLKSGKNVIYDANLNQFIHRQEKYEICRRVGAKPQLVWVKTSEIIARKRATEDAHKTPEHRPFGNMNVDMFERLLRQLEPPDSNEKAIVIKGNKISKKSISLALSF